MNQAILFNDDLSFDKTNDAYCLTALLAGELITIYFHSTGLKPGDEIDSCTKFDLEEIVELWLEKNEPEGNTIHIEMR
ncbi:hypothetical protein [Colwellia ponticola]|uniref:Uncharacterized protein n=1 Tax=Colwellia ponticola TaxID=2304625 RepID=A0A8H2PKH9_9GAMM|nr:hypothetical protein [Colwellia ponticola]RGP39421.1 hypothetical protein BPTFM16_02936 [Altererythrobacter insulae]TMM45202.1 hypothetical protein FCS21_08915 [Colwellia ponticola]